jgi:hypothetical protein
MTFYFQNVFIRVRKIAKNDYWIRHVSLPVCLSVCVCLSVYLYVCLFVCLSVGTEKLVSQRTDFYKN